MAERLSEIKEEAESQKVEEPAKTLYLKFDLFDTKLYDKVKLILSLYQGNCPVMARNTSDNKSYKINKTISANNLLVNELIGLLGEDCVILK